MMRSTALSQSWVFSCGLLSALHWSFHLCHSRSVMLELEIRAMGMNLGLVPTWRWSHLLVSCPFGSLYGLMKGYPGSLHPPQNPLMHTVAHERHLHYPGGCLTAVKNDHGILPHLVLRMHMFHVRIQHEGDDSMHAFCLAQPGSMLWRYNGTR